MARERLAIRNIRESRRLKWTLRRSHRDTARSLQSRLRNSEVYAPLRALFPSKGQLQAQRARGRQDGCAPSIIVQWRVKERDVVQFLEAPPRCDEPGASNSPGSSITGHVRFEAYLDSKTENPATLELSPSRLTSTRRRRTRHPPASAQTGRSRLLASRDRANWRTSVDALIRLADEAAAKGWPAEPLTNKSVPDHRLVGVSCG
jgi:hypothetical protein